MFSTIELFSEILVAHGMRVGELLSLRTVDILNDGIALPKTKARGTRSATLLDQQLSDKLREYAVRNNLQPIERLFPFTLIQSRKIIRDICKKHGLKSAHELRKHVLNDVIRKP